jgi:hypothetical protein
MCGKDFNTNGFLKCAGVLHLARNTFYFHRSHMRYLRSYMFGYVDGKDEARNTPLVGACECTKFN